MNARPAPDVPAACDPVSAEVEAEAGAQRWTFRAPCCLTPRQFMGALGGLAAAVGVCGAAFTALGFGWIGAFALLDVLVLAAAGVAYARQASDGDTLTLAGGHLHVHQRRGTRTHHTVFQAAFVRVVCTGGPATALELHEGRRRLAVATQLRPADRPAVARALREALRAASAGGPTGAVASDAVAATDAVPRPTFAGAPADPRSRGDAATAGHPALRLPPPPRTPPCPRSPT